MLGRVPHLVCPAEPLVSTVFLRSDTHWRAVHVRRGVRQALPQGHLAKPPAAAAGPRCCAGVTLLSDGWRLESSQCRCSTAPHPFLYSTRMFVN